MTARLNGQELPESWIQTSVRTLFEVQYGKGLTKSTRNESGTIPVYGSSGIVGYHDEALVNGPCIIVGRKGAAGAVHLSSSDCWPIDTTYFVHVPKNLSLKYIYFLLINLRLESLDRSTAIPGLNRDDFYAQDTSIPPLNEQHRIVDAIETQFTRLDAAVTALKRSQANLKRYRASVLKAACEGRLVPTEAELAQTEGRSYEPASVLLDRILTERRQQWMAENPKKRYKEPVAPDTSGLPELPEGWVWASMEQLADLVSGVTKGRNFNGKQTVSLPYLRVANVQQGWLNLDEVKQIEALPEDRDRYHLEVNDLLLTEGGDLDKLGRSAIWRGQIDDCIHQNHIFRARPHHCDVSTLWLMYNTNSQQGRSYFMRTGKQTTNLASINMTQLRGFPVPLPPPTEQHRIVAEVERRLSLVDQLEKTIEADLARANRLRQSILKLAFTGKLVPQDPHDEPASVLLERIQAAKNGEPVQPPLIVGQE